MVPVQPDDTGRAVTNEGEIDYDRWHPEMPAVMDTKQLAELSHGNDQIIRTWVREGVIPAHRRPGGRWFTVLRHGIFDWLIANRYEPGTGESVRSGGGTRTHNKRINSPFALAEVSPGQGATSL